MDYEIKLNYRFNGELTDDKFNAAIRSVMKYAEKQIMDKNSSVVFKTTTQYYTARKYISHYLQQYNADYHYVTKYILVLYTIDMISAMPTPNMRKKTLNYLNSQIATYCYSKRPYSNQIPNYPYKSKNIVDLLEEVEQVRQARVSAGLSRQNYR